MIRAIFADGSVVVFKKHLRDAPVEATICIRII